MVVQNSSRIYIAYNTVSTAMHTSTCYTETSTWRSLERANRLVGSSSISSLAVHGGGNISDGEWASVLESSTTYLPRAQEKNVKTRGRGGVRERDCVPWRGVRIGSK